MAITNPEAVRFVSEVVRPLSEKTRALKAEIDAATTQWFGGMNAKFPNDSSVVEDGREAEGVSRLTGADVNGVMGNLIAASSAVNPEIIAKPTVRALSAS